MSLQSSVVVVFAMIASTACMSDHMDSKRTEMGEEIVEMRGEIQNHRDLCSRAGTMTDVMSELVRHEQRMGEAVGEVNGTMDGMGSCGSGMHGMMQTMHELDEAMNEHRQRLEGLGDPASAHQECVAHADAMLGFCDDLQRDNDAMGCM